MKAPFVTLTPEELMSISAEVRNKVREAVTPRRIQSESKVATHVLAEESTPDDSTDTNQATNQDMFSEENSITIPDPYETYLNNLCPGQIPEAYTVARESYALRSVLMEINKTDSVESVIDPGSQIIAMSEAVCHDLSLHYDPTIKVHMQSANGEVDQSLGLSRNVPCRLGTIVLFLQIHVIRNPAYDILIGRPFDVLTQSTVKNFANADQTITITDPNSDRVITIPTIARGPPRFRNVKTILKSDFRDSRS
jgi:hypothetical protein